MCLRGIVLAIRDTNVLSASGQVYVSTSVRFDEVEFPFKLNPEFGENYDRENVIVLPDLSSTLSMFLL